MKNTYHEDVPYYHDNNAVTLYNVQEIQNDGQAPMYVLSESQNNVGPGFENQWVRDEVAQDLSSAIQSAHDIEPKQVNLYQQRTDGNFDRVYFREIGRDGQSAADQEARESGYEQNNSTSIEEPLPREADLPEFTESKRTLYTRDEVEAAVGNRLEASELSPQQTAAQDAETQWQGLDGPEINRARELESAAQSRQENSNRSQEQNMQMTQYQEQDQHSHEY